MVVKEETGPSSLIRVITVTVSRGAGVARVGKAAAEVFERACDLLVSRRDHYEAAYREEAFPRPEGQSG
ncbi:hypothetical protein U7230_10570 [Carboxydochorda subterranea]|uniref:Uncharacterized protein n=1 Tax=Carboxydichorda subterranea TaxID=3109565 RepID=A0ABZ1BVB7_9FIRM|nr:hypothetical protein [Limnochorda sp. L945t]WRP16533.1 hypothetical protein U7230_10570 [Limnochorda sp. L945t]